MIKMKYPLLYYTLRPDTVLGILVGTDYQVIDKDVKSIKTNLHDYLHRQYKKYDEYPYMNILEPKLKIVEVKIRPNYKTESGSFPMSESLKIPVPVIYGETGPGHYECYLPLFNESFYYYESKQFGALVKHFATDLLNRLKPEELHRYLMYQKPVLDIVELRVNENRDFNWSSGNYQREYKTLSKLAVKYPYAKSVQRNMSTFPDAAWELEDKVDEVVEKLLVSSANVLLVGSHGVGKSAVLKQAIRKIHNQTKKQQVNMTFWQMMPQRITASSKYLGEWQQTCEEIVNELIAANGVLWMVDIVRLLQIGGEGAEDSVAAFLVAFLQQNKLQLVGEVTEQELESMRRLLPGFVENFQLVKIKELPDRKIQLILDKFADYSAKNLKITIEEDALMLSYRLLLCYYPYESFPGKAVKFIGRCVSEAQINSSNTIDKKDVISSFIQQTGLPELFLRDDLLLDQEDLHEHFNSAIIGQPDAVNSLSGIIKVFKAGLNNPKKPIATLVFAGPTGVGKTASAKALANYFFGKGQKRSPLIRIDMSEFQHPSQIVRFIGAGKEVGKLVQDIRERPFSVLLLDEVEKADPSIFDVLLTVLDEGMLVDAFGRVTNFRNTIIIMTTNLGASNRASIGFGNTTSDSAKYESALAAHFRPEFINRIDDVVMFNALTADNIRLITLKELEELKKREGFMKRGLDLQFSDKVVDHIASIGFDERYGARPLQRAIEQSIISPIANWLLNHPDTYQTTLKIDYDKGLKIKK